MRLSARWEGWNGGGAAGTLRTMLDRFCPRCGGPLSGSPGFCNGCGHVHYLDPKLAAGVIFRWDGGLFLLRRAIEPSHGLWTFPGGFVDRGETVEAAAVREASEEAGVKVRLDDLLGIYSYEGRPTVVVVYTGTVLEGVPAACSECLEARPFPEPEIPWDALAFDSTREALQHYLETDPDARPVPRLRNPPAE